MKTIDQLREEIDMRDNRILDLLSERINIVRKIAIQKKEVNLPVFNKKREEQVRKKWLSKAESLGLENRQAQNILEEIMKMSKETQRRSNNEDSVSRG